MSAPLTYVLNRVFVREFFRAHAGLFTFCFTSIFCYCFYIIPTHNLPPDVFIRENLRFTLSLLTAPDMTLAMYTAWFFYTLKSWQYTGRQLRINSNAFIFYSVLSYPRHQQYRSWFTIQCTIHTPLFAYSVLVLITGVVYEEYAVAILTPIYVLFLSALSAVYYVRLSNSRVGGDSGPGMLRQAGIQKSFALLPLYYLMNRGKLSFAISKLLSALALVSIFYLFEYEAGDVRVPALIMLLIATAHTWLMLNLYRFEEIYLSIGRNLPFRRTHLYFRQLSLCLIIMLPEIIWLLTNFGLRQASGLLLFLAGLSMVYCTLLYRTGIHVQRYLQAVFMLFIVFFILILSGGTMALTAVSFLASYLVFHRYYYDHRATVRT
jgi:hypothetical protein